MQVLLIIFLLLYKNDIDTKKEEKEIEKDKNSKKETLEQKNIFRFLVILFLSLLTIYCQ